MWRRGTGVARRVAAGAAALLLGCAGALAAPGAYHASIRGLMAYRVGGIWP